MTRELNVGGVSDVPQNLLQACRNYGAVPLVMGKVTPGERQLLVA